MTQKPRVKIKRLPDRPGDTGGYNWDHGEIAFESVKRSFVKPKEHHARQYKKRKNNFL